MEVFESRQISRRYVCFIFLSLAKLNKAHARISFAILDLAKTYLGGSYFEITQTLDFVRKEAVT